jgi:hypothetical protein
MWPHKDVKREKIYKTPTISTTTIHAHSFQSAGDHKQFIKNPESNYIVFVTRLFSGNDFTQTQNFP